MGIYFGYNKDECKKLNLEKLLEKINKLICSWSKRRLSIMGKIVIIKSLLLPNITYLASNMIIPKDYLQKIKTKLYNFIWDGKRDRVKRDILSKNYEKGGLRMVDIEVYIKTTQVKWITKLIDKEQAN